MEKIKLPDVTLCCISSVNLDQAAYALAKSCEGIEFAEAKLIGHQRPDSLPDYIGFEESYQIKSIDEYSFYCIYNLTNHVKTKHCILVQPDGYIIRPWLWDNSWLQYDYIGAPWPDRQQQQDAFIDPWGKAHRVGNGGFTLRSKKLLDVPKHAHIQFDVNWGDFYKHMGANLTAEDGNICVHNRHIYEVLGCKFAPVEVASKFSREQTLPDSEEETFGFHYHFQSIR
jgi:hypothetical protein